MINRGSYPLIGPISSHACKECLGIFGVGDEEFGFADWYEDNLCVYFYLLVGREQYPGQGQAESIRRSDLYTSVRLC